ncbi:MAG: SprT family zinc-dependent metalloprotease [Bauldia sp.]
MAFFARRAAEPIPDSFEIATGAGVVSVDLRRHPRARNYTLRVAGPARAPVLTMPKRGTLHEARRFLDRHVDWLQRQMEKLPAPTVIADGASIPLRGAMHVIRHQPGTRGTVSIGTDPTGPAIIVPTPGMGDAGQVRRRVVEFLKREAKRDLEWAVIRHTLAAGVRAKAVRLRDQTSRWGSCSADGHLSFSWRLVMAPPAVLDYLSAHEVAHLRELNHSYRFWHICKALAPQSDAARTWLQQNGPALHAIGAE